MTIIRTMTTRAIQRAQRAMGLPMPGDVMKTFELDPATLAEVSASFPDKGDIATLFFSHKGRVIHKWVHFLAVYDRHFAPYRKHDVKMLEIGVNRGGSLELWRNYFGEQATIFGIDIDPECRQFVDEPSQVRTGSQADAAFLKRVVEEMGAPDIILDDGSHIGQHQWASFKALFPLLALGGIYMIEDLHTAYWPGRTYDGGYGAGRTGIGLVRQIIDDMHGWYHDRPARTPAQHWIASVHQYDSIVVIEKGFRGQPGHIKTS